MRKSNALSRSRTERARPKDIDSGELFGQMPGYPMVPWGLSTVRRNRRGSTGSSPCGVNMRSSPKKWLMPAAIAGVLIFLVLVLVILEFFLCSSNDGRLVWAIHKLAGSIRFSKLNAPNFPPPPPC